MNGILYIPKFRSGFVASIAFVFLNVAIGPVLSNCSVAQERIVPDRLAPESTFFFAQTDSVEKSVRSFFLEWYPMFYREAVDDGLLAPYEIPSPRKMALGRYRIKHNWLSSVFNIAKTGNKSIDKQLKEIHQLTKLDEEEDLDSENCKLLVNKISSLFGSGGFLYIYPESNRDVVVFGFAFDREKFDWKSYIASVVGEKNTSTVGSQTIYTIPGEQIRFVFFKDFLVGVASNNQDDIGDFLTRLNQREKGSNLESKRNYLRVKNRFKGKRLDLFCYVDVNAPRVKKILVGNKSKATKERDVFSAFGFGVRIEENKIHYQAAYAVYSPIGKAIKRMADRLDAMDPAAKRTVPGLATIACFKKANASSFTDAPGEDLYTPYWIGKDQTVLDSDFSNVDDKLGAQLISTLHGKYETCDFLTFHWSGESKYYTSGNPRDVNIFRGIRLIAPHSGWGNLSEFADEKSNEFLKDLGSKSESADGQSSKVIRTLAKENSVELSFNAPVGYDLIFDKKRIYEGAGSTKERSFTFASPLAKRNSLTSERLVGIMVRRNFAGRVAQMDSLQPLFKLLISVESKHFASLSNGVIVEGDMDVTYKSAIDERSAESTFLTRAIREPIALLNYELSEPINLTCQPVVSTDTVHYEYLFLDENKGFIDYYGRYESNYKKKSNKAK